MARKQKAQEVPAKDGVIYVTYVGDKTAVMYLGQTFLRGVPVAVDDDATFVNRTYFEVSRGNVHTR